MERKLASQVTMMRFTIDGNTSWSRWERESKSRWWEPGEEVWLDDETIKTQRERTSVLDTSGWLATAFMQLHQLIRSVQWHSQRRLWCDRWLVLFGDVARDVSCSVCDNGVVHHDAADWLESYHSTEFTLTMVIIKISVKGGVPPSWASYLFHVKMTLLNAPGSWATLGQKLRSLLQNKGQDMLFTLLEPIFD